MVCWTPHARHRHDHFVHEVVLQLNRHRPITKRLQEALPNLRPRQSLCDPLARHRTRHVSQQGRSEDILLRPPKRHDPRPDQLCWRREQLRRVITLHCGTSASHRPQLLNGMVEPDSIPSNRKYLSLPIFPVSAARHYQSELYECMNTYLRRRFSVTKCYPSLGQSIGPTSFFFYTSAQYIFTTGSEGLRCFYAFLLLCIYPFLFAAATRS